MNPRWNLPNFFESAGCECGRRRSSRSGCEALPRDRLAAAKLDDAWADGPHTYLGISIAGFPNFLLFDD
jgi:hypothetical protein